METISIVLIHGLNGDSISTWTSTVTKSCWASDLEFLPPLFPTARVLTFGYNANIMKNAVEGRITEFAENLLGELEGVRYRDAVSSLSNQLNS
jgi:hypothetical protein